ALTLFRRIVDAGEVARRCATLQCQDLRNGRGRARLAMVHVTNGAHVHVRLAAIKLCLTHCVYVLLDACDFGTKRRGPLGSPSEALNKLEPTSGLEPETSSLPRTRSTTELCGPETTPPRGCLFGGQGGIRTPEA